MAKSMAIFRTDKLSGWSSVSGSAAHMMRKAHALNADPERVLANRIIVGSADPVSDLRERLDGVWFRDNSVLAIEFMISASPEWWAAADDTQTEDWLAANVKFLRGAFGVDNVIHVQLHMDEKTPHLTGFISPVVNGRLNAKHFLGGRQKLQALQDQVAQVVAHLGVKRGVKGSQATHQTLKKFYGALDNQVDTPPPEIMPLLVKLAKDSDANNRAAKEATARLRAIDLTSVLEAAGLERSARDSKRWVDAEGEFAITVAGVKWFDHKAGFGKGGAIDLVQHLLHCDFATARGWLASRFDRAQLVADAAFRAERTAAIELGATVPVEFVPPIQDETQWAKVRSYLVSERGLLPSMIDAHHQSGDIYADRRGNAVFLARDENGVPVGAEVRGTDPARAFKGSALGSRKDRGAFSIGSAAARVVVVVESAIEAISYAMLMAMEGVKDVLTNTRILSTGGVRTKPPSGTEGKRLICAYNADKAGDQAAVWGERVRPRNAKDWNAELTRRLAARRARHVGSIAPAFPSTGHSPFPVANAGDAAASSGVTGRAVEPSESEAPDPGV